MPELVARSENSVPMLTQWPARRASDRGLTEQETPPQHLAKRDIFGILKVWRRRGSWRFPTDEVFQSVNGLYALTPNTVKFLRKRSSKCPANFYLVAGFFHCLFGQPRQTKVCRTSVPANRPWVMTIQNPQQVLAGRQRLLGVVATVINGTNEIVFSASSLRPRRFCGEAFAARSHR